MTFKTCYLPELCCPTEEKEEEEEDCSVFQTPLLSFPSDGFRNSGWGWCITWAFQIQTQKTIFKKSTTFHRKLLKKSPSVNHHICIKLWKKWCLLACCLKTRTFLSVRIIANPLFTVPHWRVLCLLKIPLIADRFDFSVTAGVLLLAFTSSNCFIFLPLLSKTEFPSPPAWTGRNDFFLCY